MSKSSSILKFKKLSPSAIAPVRTSPYSVGYDLSSPRSAVVPANNWITLFTDIAISLPPGTYGRVAPRSGLAALQGITVDAGVIDPDYIGNIGVVLVNRSQRHYIIHQGERIAQLICEKAEYPELEEVHELQSTSRGKSGFGSTGFRPFQKNHHGNKH